MRIRRSEPVGDFPAPPPELAERCHVEDWISPTDSPPAYWSESWADWVLVAASRQWRDAREAWLDEHQVPPRRQCELVPFRRPQWRNPPR